MAPAANETWGSAVEIDEFSCGLVEFNASCYQSTLRDFTATVHPFMPIKSIQEERTDHEMSRAVAKDIFTEKNT